MGNAERVQQWVDDNRERSRAIKRRHYLANKAKNHASAAARQRTPKGRARIILNNALKLGKLVKPAGCWQCGSTERVEAHHVAYDLPLAVTWLCSLCHGRVHRGA